MCNTAAPLLPPGPPSSENPSARFLADPFGYLEESFTRWGPLFSLPLGNVGHVPFPEFASTGDWVFLTSPHHLKVMYETDEKTCTAAEANKLFFGTNEGSVAYIDGPVHRRRRQMLLPHFGGHADHAALLLAELTRRSAHWPHHAPLRLFPEFQRITASVITTVVCGAMPSADRAFISRLLPATENASSSRAEVLAADAAIRQRISDHMPHYRHRLRPSDADILAFLLHAADKGEEELTDEVVRDEVFSLLYTGFSTTANTLAWAILRLADDKAALARLRAEITAHIEGPVAPNTVGNLPYLDAVIRETLRLHPVTALNGVRFTHRALVLDGYCIPAGAVLVHCAYLLQRSPAVYTSPLSFNPARFLGRSAERYTWAPFGGGNHLCPGRGFATQILKTALAYMVTNFALHREGPLPAAQLQGFFMAPADGAAVELCPLDERESR